MNNEAKLRAFSSLQFFKRRDYRYNLLWTGRGVRPIGKKTIPEIFVHNTVAALDDLLASRNPRSEKNIQVLALHMPAEGRKTANVRDQKPTGNILDLPQRSLEYVRLVLL